MQPSLIVDADQQTSGDDAAPDGVGASQRQWLAVRGSLKSRRHDLSLAAQHLYPASCRVAGTPLLTRPGWLPGTPIPLDQVRLTWHDSGPPAIDGTVTDGTVTDGTVTDGTVTDGTVTDGTGPEFAAVLPLREDGSRFGSYASALAALDRPGLFEDRSCYRLVDVAATAHGAHLAFGPGRYFDMVNVCEAAAHEFAAAAMARGGPGPRPALAQLPLRAHIGDPADLLRRRVMVALCTLVLRADRASGEATMLLHWRDPARVVSGGGLYQVAPAGMFQPSHDAEWNRANDFDLWRTIVRELSEELLGTGEDYRSDLAPIDYGRWPFYTSLAEARQARALRVYWLGLGIDPLTFATDLLTVAVFDAPVFDAVFAGLVEGNDEGRLVTGGSTATAGAGVAFSEENVHRFTAAEPMQAAGAALLRMAWAHRRSLLTPDHSP
jgi:hypothetical protein